MELNYWLKKSLIRINACKMEVKYMSQDELQRELITQLSTLNAEVPQLKEAMRDIKDNITLVEGKSQLRDSVTLLVKNQIDGQEDRCVSNMRKLADSVVSIKIDDHKKEFHSKTSMATSSNAVRVDVANLKPMIKWFIALLLGGGSLFGTYQIGQNNTTEPASHAEPERIEE